MDTSARSAAPETTWTPLIAPAGAARVHEALRAIAITRASADEPGIGSAIAGALFFAYHDAVIGDRRLADVAQVRVDRVIERMPAVARSPWLHGGVVGATWLVQHLDPDASDDLDGFDATLAEMAGASPWRGHFDLVSGLVGHGVYALERWPQPAARQLLSRVVDRLHELSAPRGRGLAWWTPPELLVPALRVHDPDGHVDVGVAHGVPGVIALLAAACAAGVNVRRARPLYDGALRWLRGQLGAVALPCTVSIGDRAALSPPRTAWCYGEPGAAAALLAAARATGDAALERDAIGLGLRAAGRDVATSGVGDAGICHGSAGLAHVFNRLWQGTGDPRFAAAARAWIDVTLDHLAAGAVHDDTGSLLTSIDGIGLVLLAAVGDHEPRWDRLLLMSLPTP
jgi:hypothetical protein